MIDHDTSPVPPPDSSRQHVQVPSAHDSSSFEPYEAPEQTGSSEDVRVASESDSRRAWKPAITFAAALTGFISTAISLATTLVVDADTLSVFSSLATLPVIGVAALAAGLLAVFAFVDHERKTRSLRNEGLRADVFKREASMFDTIAARVGRIASNA